MNIKLRLTIFSLFMFMGIHLVWTFKSKVDLTIVVKEGDNLLIDFFCRKVHENEIKFGRDGAHPLCPLPSLGSTNGRLLSFSGWIRIWS